MSVPIPIPPRSLVLHARVNWQSDAKDEDLGKVFRVGYYSPQDGLDCIWLVADDGDYEQTIDHDYLSRYFDVLEVSDEDQPFGEDRDVLEPLTEAERRHIAKLARRVPA